MGGSRGREDDLGVPDVREAGEERRHEAAPANPSVPDGAAFAAGETRGGSGFSRPRPQIVVVTS